MGVLPAEGARGRRAPPGARARWSVSARRMARGLRSLASGERRPAGAL